jgi:ubiquinone/menaquinone biosynthesis C-methylase UbiE
MVVTGRSELDNADYDREQLLVDEYFNRNSDLWYNTYHNACQKNAADIVNKLRQDIALKYFDNLFLPKTACILEIGCGAGCIAISIARKGFSVDAVDHSNAMVKMAKRHTTENGMENRIRVAIEDIHKLTFDDQSFDLIIALGVMGWLHDLKKGLTEIRRVLKPGGYTILDSTHAHALLNPLSLPLIESFFRARERWATRNNGQKTATPHFYLAKEFHKYLSEVNLKIVDYRVFGFGPFIVMNHKLFSDHVEKKIQQKLQQYADAGVPIIRSSGTQNVVLARKVNPKGSR